MASSLLGIASSRSNSKPFPIGSGPPINTYVTAGSGTSYTLNQSFTLASQALVTVTPTTPPGACRVEDCEVNGIAGRGGVYELITNGAPASSTGQYKAIPGSRATDNSGGHWYRNAGTALSPSWSEAE